MRSILTFHVSFPAILCGLLLAGCVTPRPSGVYVPSIAKAAPLETDEDFFAPLVRGRFAQEKPMKDTTVHLEAFEQRITSLEQRNRTLSLENRELRDRLAATEQKLKDKHAADSSRYAAEAAARKREADSTARAMAGLRKQQAADSARAFAESRRRQAADSAQAAAYERQKQRADSTARVLAETRRKQAADSARAVTDARKRQTAESARVAAYERERQRADSTARVLAETRRKQAADSARAVAAAQRAREKAKRDSAAVPIPGSRPFVFGRDTTGDARMAKRKTEHPTVAKFYVSNEDFNKGLDAYDRGDYAAALDQFQLLQKNKIEETLQDDCLYWSGECYYEAGKYIDAIRSLRSVFAYAISEYKPAAYVMIGKSFEKLNRLEDAREAYRTVIRQFPQTPENSIARRKLQLLK